MKLLFIFTGGTIGSTVNGDIISTDSKKPYLILEKYREIYGLGFEYDILQPYTELSENNTGTTIRKLIGTVSENLSKGYDGIIITHGTDTIQYSAAVLSYTVKTDIPLCLVSSNYTIENPKSNGLVNLHCAIRFIESVKTAGVWVSYKNQNDIPRIHKGSRLLERQAFTDCIFSIMDSYYGSFDGDFSFHTNPEYRELPDSMDYFIPDTLTEEADNILRIEPYLGMVYPNIDQKIKYILHGSYHSGTINTKSIFPSDFFAAANKRGIKIFLTGTESGECYESTQAFKDLHLIPVNNISPISAYVKLWLCAAAGYDPEVILGQALAGDIVP